MSGVSFGKMTPQTQQFAQLQLEGMRMITKSFPMEEACTKLANEEDAFVRAINDPDYLFDINPNLELVDESLNGGQLEYADKNSFIMFKTGKGNDKYSYLGKFGLLQDGYKLADKINRIIKLPNRQILGADKRIAALICNADKSRNFKDAIVEGQKILNLEA